MAGKDLVIMTNEKLTNENNRNMLCSKCGGTLAEEVHQMGFTNGEFHRSCYDFRLTPEERTNCGDLLWQV